MCAQDDFSVDNDRVRLIDLLTKDKIKDQDKY